MQIDVNDQSKIVAVWLSRAEQVDDTYRLPIREICETYKNKNYTVVFFKSGHEDLYNNTLDLLRFNKRRSAEIAIQQKKMR